MELKDLVQDKSEIEIDHLMIFETAISGFYEGKLVTILPDSKMLLPYTFLLPINDFDNFKRKCRNGKLLLPISKKIDYQSIQLEAGLLNKEDPKLQQFVKNFLIVFRDEQNSLLTDVENKSESHDKIFELLEALKKKDLTGLDNIIGDGIGLTPAMDDFILGLYSYLIAREDLDRMKLLERYIYQNMDKTTLVSKWALKYAVDSQLFTETLSKFYHSKNISDLIPMLRHGSSSGLDMITGIYYGMKILK